jgi:hypothetical protein
VAAQAAVDAAHLARRRGRPHERGGAAQRQHREQLAGGVPLLWCLRLGFAFGFGVL